MQVDVVEMQSAVEKGRIEWRKHTLQRLTERLIQQKDVLQILRLGEAIRFYDTDRPFPSVLMFGWVNDRPLHIVVAYNKESDTVYIITVYEPSLDVFEADYKTKKQ